MRRTDVEELLKKASSPRSAELLGRTRAKVPEVVDRAQDDEEEEHVPVGLNGLLAASEKLLAVNRGLDGVDERDSLAFKRFFTTDKLLAERIQNDTDKVRRRIMYAASKHRNLKSVAPFALDPYADSMLMGNPLTAPLEEINPLQLMEQSRRITQMGPGGIGSPQAITEEMQSVRGDQFGFLSPIEGPESLDHNTFIFTDLGWVAAPDLTSGHHVACNIDGCLEFHLPEKCTKYHYTGDMIGVKTMFMDFLVTPDHRIWHRETDKRNKGGTGWRMKFAKDIFNRAVNFEMGHEPWEGDGYDVFMGIEGCEFPMGLWCKFLAYWMADGSSFQKGHQTRITHSKARPAYKGICDTLDLLGLDWEYRDTPHRRRDSDFPTGDFIISHPGVTEYLRQFGKAGTKYLPDYVLQQSVDVREAVWQALMETDCRINKTHTSFVSTSKRFARGVERLLVSLGHSASFREEPDSREYVNSTNWVVSKLKERSRQARFPSKNGWYKEPYDDFVYCVTVPGGMIFTRRGDGLGHWTGNSEKIGIDTRAAWGTKIGSDGRLYQVFRDRKTGKRRYLSPGDLDGATVKLPD